MATDNTETKVVTLNNLQHFYEGLHNVFISEETADGKYAEIDGNNSKPFSASEFRLSNASRDDVSMTLVHGDTPAININFANSDNSTATVVIPATNGVLRTSESKADKVVIANQDFLTTPFISAFDGFASVHQRYTPTIYSVGTIVIFWDDPGILRNEIYNEGFGVYIVRSIDANNHPTLVSKICPLSDTALYYCRAASKFYTKKKGANQLTDVTPQGGGGSSDETEYTFASDEEIDDIFAIISGSN